MKKTTTTEQLKTAMLQVKGVTAQVARATAQDLAALKESKADKLTGVSIVIPTSGWGSDSTATYPKYYDIAVTGVTTSDRASMDIAPASLSTAATCGLCPATETLAGKIRIRAVSVPEAAMTANYWIEVGKE